MPLPMVHLAIAWQIRQLEAAPTSPDFLLGCISPDAIHMRPHAGRDDKERVHLLTNSKFDSESARKMLRQHAQGQSQAAQFTTGYVSHLLADRIWVEAVVDPFRKRHPPTLSPEEERTLYYLETDQVDFDLYRRVPWRLEVWSQLASAHPFDFLTLLTAGEIGAWRDKTLIWFEKLKEEPLIEPVYITTGDVNVFIDRAARAITQTFAAWRSIENP